MYSEIKSTNFNKQCKTTKDKILLFYDNTVRHQSWIRHQFYLLNCNLLENEERARLLSTRVPSVKFETYVPM